jgi:hypothetical protein
VGSVTSPTVFKRGQPKAEEKLVEQNVSLNGFTVTPGANVIKASSKLDTLALTN